MSDVYVKHQIGEHEIVTTNKDTLWGLGGRWPGDDLDHDLPAPPLASAILFQVDISLQIWSSSFPQLFFSYFPSLGNGSILSFPDTGEWRFSKYFLLLRSSLRSAPYLPASGSISSEVSSPPKGLGLFSHKVKPSCPRYQNPRGISISRELKKTLFQGRCQEKWNFFNFVGPLPSLIINMSLPFSSTSLAERGESQTEEEERSHGCEGAEEHQGIYTSSLTTSLEYTETGATGDF